MCQKQLCPSNGTYMPTTVCADIRLLCQYTFFIDLNAINNVTTGSGTNTLTLLVYAPEQICLPYCTNVSHYTSAVVYVHTPHYLTYT